MICDAVFATEHSQSVYQNVRSQVVKSVALFDRLASLDATPSLLDLLDLLPSRYILPINPYVCGCTSCFAQAARCCSQMHKNTYVHDYNSYIFV